MTRAEKVAQHLEGLIEKNRADGRMHTELAEALARLDPKDYPSIKALMSQGYTKCLLEVSV